MNNETDKCKRVSAFCLPATLIISSCCRFAKSGLDFCGGFGLLVVPLCFVPVDKAVKDHVLYCTATVTELFDDEVRYLLNLQIQQSDHLFAQLDAEEMQRHFGPRCTEK